MPAAPRILAFTLLLLAFANALADSSIKLTPFPSMSVADGRSTVTITAEIRDQNGHVVADGTRVEFDTTVGTFRETSAATVSGFARAVLVAPTTSGVATITATALTGGVSPTTLTYEFYADRSSLSSAKEYIEIVSPSYMQYAQLSSGVKIIAAAAPNGGVSLKYRDISLTADDIQLSINEYELRARKVKLKMGKFEKDFDELNLLLDRRTGFGTTTYKRKRPDVFVTQGPGLAFAKQGTAGQLQIPPDEDRYGLVDVGRFGVSASEKRNPAIFFTFTDLSHAASTISARKAIVFPKRKIQFQAAKIYIAGSKVFTIPLMEYDLTIATPLVTEQMLGIEDSQLEINYPYILSMKPGETSLLRFRTGDEYGRGETVDRGAFLDYELHWDRGDDMQGSFIFSGIGRTDWDAAFSEYLRLDDRTSASAQLLTPAGTGFFGTALMSHQFNGFSASLSGDASRTFEGIQFTTEDYSATLAKDPIKVGALPLKLFLELTATSSSNQLLHETQSGEGTRARLQSTPIHVIDRNTTVTSSVTASYLSGQNELHGPQFLATSTLAHTFSSAFSAGLTYNFTRDGFNEYVIGEHQLSLQTTYHTGRFEFTNIASKSLDIKRETLFSDLGYKFSNLWRIKAGYTYDNYLDTTYIDYNFGFGYRIAWREVGLIWSEQTRRIGFQFLGVTVF